MELLMRNGKWAFPMHRIGINACDGMILPLEESVENKDALTAVLSPMDTTARESVQKRNTEPPDARNDHIQARFETFHAKNPQVLERLVERARFLKRRGRQRIAVAEIWEWLRYEASKDVESGERFRVSNDFRSRYSRLLLHDYPEFEGFLMIRELTAK